MTPEQMKIRRYVDQELERLESTRDPWHTGEAAALLKLKRRFLLTEEESKAVEKARAEMFG